MSFIPAQAFKEIARGDEAAEAFMGQFYLWTHMQDDLYDRDKTVLPEQMTGFNLGLLQVVAANPFFQRHQNYLWPVLHMSALAWIASEDFKKKSGVLDHITAQVLKSQYMDVFFAVAFCIGGFDYALAVARKFREYDFDCKTG